jgi:quercetin 2,3-dioxygenase
LIIKITIAEKFGNSHIAILFPDNAYDQIEKGIRSNRRIDQTTISGGTNIKMNQQVNDEIMTYFRIGNVIHTDSANHTETISRKKLMLMKAGKVFYHEELMIDKLEGLQIFIHPQT